MLFCNLVPAVCHEHTDLLSIQNIRAQSLADTFVLPEGKRVIRTFLEILVCMDTVATGE